MLKFLLSILKRNDVSGHGFYVFGIFWLLDALGLDIVSWYSMFFLDVGLLKPVPIGIPFGMVNGWLALDGLELQTGLVGVSNLMVLMYLPKISNNSPKQKVWVGKHCGWEFVQRNHGFLARGSFLLLCLGIWSYGFHVWVGFSQIGDSETCFL